MRIVESDAFLERIVSSSPIGVVLCAGLRARHSSDTRTVCQLLPKHASSKRDAKIFFLPELFRFSIAQRASCTPNDSKTMRKGYFLVAIMLISAVDMFFFSSYLFCSQYAFACIAVTTDLTSKEFCQKNSFGNQQEI